MTPAVYAAVWVDVECSTEQGPVEAIKYLNDRNLMCEHLFQTQLDTGVWQARLECVGRGSPQMMNKLVSALREIREETGCTYARGDEPRLSG
jgi:hypothetical protein